MLVAACAVDGDAEKRRGDAAHDVVAIEVQRDAFAFGAVGLLDERALVENYAALIDEIVRAKPSAAKGRYIKKITLTSTMGPGIHVDPLKTRGIVDELVEAEAVTA